MASELVERFPISSIPLLAYYGIGLDHHKANSDSHAAAEILLRYMGKGVDLGKWTRIFWLGGQQ
jgi:hypothetical protein